MLPLSLNQHACRFTFHLHVLSGSKDYENLRDWSWKKEKCKLSKRHWGIRSLLVTQEEEKNTVSVVFSAEQRTIKIFQWQKDQ